MTGAEFTISLTYRVIDPAGLRAVTEYRPAEKNLRFKKNL